HCRRRRDAHMSQPNPLQLVIGAAYLLPALVWAIVAADLWALAIHHRPRSQVSRLLTWLTTGAAAFFVFGTIFTLLPAELHDRRPPLLVAAYVVQDLIVLAAIAMTRHLGMVMPLNSPAPTRRWLVTHYGIALALAGLDIYPDAIPAPTWQERLVIL